MLPALRAGNGGYIVNIGSLADIVGLPFSGLYCASKFAREGMSESLRLETRPFGIHVVLVEPGDFRTQITAKRCVAEASQNSAYRTAFDKYREIIVRRPDCLGDLDSNHDYRSQSRFPGPPWGALTRLPTSRRNARTTGHGRQLPGHLPLLGETVELFLEPDVEGSLAQNCEVAATPSRSRSGPKEAIAGYRWDARMGRNS